MKKLDMFYSGKTKISGFLDARARSITYRISATICSFIMESSMFEMDVLKKKNNFRLFVLFGNSKKDKAGRIVYLN